MRASSLRVSFHVYNTDADVDAALGARADDIAMVWLWSKLRLRRQIRGEEALRTWTDWQLVDDHLAGCVARRTA